jgi:hypothetical protein
MSRMLIFLAPLLLMQVISCNSKKKEKAQSDGDAGFNEDIDFLGKYTEICVLGSADDHMRVAIAPLWQGTVMTSCTSLGQLTSHGAVAYDAIEKNQSENSVNHNSSNPLNPWGGEDRLTVWDGLPGTCSSPHELSLQTVSHSAPANAEDDTLFRFEAVGSRPADGTGVRSFRVERAVQILGISKVAMLLGLPLSSTIRSVAFISTNVVRNTGPQPWDRQHGWFSLGLSGSVRPGPGQTLIVPCQARQRETPAPAGGRYLRDKLLIRSNGRLDLDEGLFKSRESQIVGNYDAVRGVLTLVESGPLTVAGMPSSGLENAAPSVAVQPGEAIERVRTTLHFQGPPAELDQIARKVLHLSIAEISTAFDPVRGDNPPPQPKH